MRRRLTPKARRRRDAETYYYVRRKRRQAALAGLALSTEPGVPNQPVGGGEGGSFITSGIIRQDVVLAGGDVIDTIVTSSAYDPGPSQILGNVQGVYGNNSVFGPGPYRVLIQGGIRYMIAGSIGSGGLR